MTRCSFAGCTSVVRGGGRCWLHAEGHGWGLDRDDTPRHGLLDRLRCRLLGHVFPVVSWQSIDCPRCGKSWSASVPP